MDDIEAIDHGATWLYQGEPYTGEAVETTMDGTVIGLSNFVDGRKEGVQREWFYKGRLSDEYEVYRGFPVGISQTWHENGQLAKRVEYEAYGRVLKQEVWDENGVPVPGETVDHT